MSDIRWLLSFARQASLPLLGSVLARTFGHTLGAIMLAVPAWALGALAIHSVSATSSSFVISVVAAVIVAALVKAILRYVEQFLGHLAAFRLMGEMRVWIIDRLIPQAPAVTDGLGAARVHTIAVRDVDRVEVFFAHTIAPAITSMLIPTAGVAAAFIAAGPLPALALVFVFAVGYMVALKGAKKSRLAARSAATTRAEMAQFVADTVRLREELIIHNATAQRLDHAASLDDELSFAMKATGIKTGIRNGVNTFRVWGGMVLVILAGLPGMQEDIAALPGVLLAASLVAGTANSMDSIERLAGSLPAGLEAVRRIRRLGAAEPSVDEPALPGKITSQSNIAVQLNSVSYRYPSSDTTVLDDINIDVPSGGFVGIAGPTGSGKSTVSRLIQRHFDADTGQVLLHGVEVRELGSETVQNLVAVADQDPFLLEGTVAENLRLGAPDASSETLRWALRAAEIDLEQFPLDSQINRRGSNLSGGQKQRLALARTLVRAAHTGEQCSDVLRESPVEESAGYGLVSEVGPGTESMQAGDASRLHGSVVIVLDEATSHQDPLTQARIVSNLRELGATTVLIAHRLKTLQNADQVYVIEAGRLVEKGTFHELAHAGGLFSSMLKAAEKN